MTVSEIREIALGLNGVTEDIKWENHLCFNVADKMFLVTNPDLFPPTASFKVADDIFDDTINRTGISKHKYLGKHNWIHLDDINRLTKSEWTKFITQSYQLVASKLPNKIRIKLNIKTTI
ncbi:MAG: MmcQ/YjbR family DNA-binding protein [Bacteroidales bacterium]|nr:MmcQ/YjbR family DNA-binding protein [Bacteroidales bacterium]